MENITIGQIAIVLAFIAAFITAVKTIGGTVSKAISKGMEKELKPINDKLDKLEKKIDDVDLNACKNFLVSCLDEVEKGEHLGVIEEERFWEQYEYYKSKGGNSYIRHRVESLEDQDKL